MTVAMCVVLMLSSGFVVGTLWGASRMLPRASVFLLLGSAWGMIIACAVLAYHGGQ